MAGAWELWAFGRVSARLNELRVIGRAPVHNPHPAIWDGSSCGVAYPPQSEAEFNYLSGPETTIVATNAWAA